MHLVRCSAWGSLLTEPKLHWGLAGKIGGTDRSSSQTKEMIGRISASVKFSLPTFLEIGTFIFLEHGSNQPFFKFFWLSFLQL